MKCLIAVLLLLQLSPALAFKDPGDPVFINPRVWNMGNSVQVDVWNTTQTDIECSGPITIWTRSNRTQTEHYWETIYRGMSRNRTYRLWDFNDQVASVNHFITCRER